MGEKKHRILIIGVGSIGERHLRCFQQTGRADVTICEINQDLREQVADRYGIRDAYVDLDAAANDPFEAAVIAVPAHLHVPLALRLAAEGKHLLIEKPLSTSLDGIPVLAKMVSDRSLVVSVAYVHRANPALAAMRHAIQAGRFGNPVQTVVSVGQHFPTYRPAYREIYYTDRATGGGAVQDSLTHMLNAAEWVIGPIDSLAADADHKVLEGVTVEDTVHVMARHGAVMASYSLNQHQAPNEATMTVVCDRGTARFEIHHSRWSWMTEPGAEWMHENHEIPERDTLFIRQADAFLDALQGKARPACSLEEGIQTLRVCRDILKCIDNPNLLQPVKRPR
jgi:predicted dehydrogenase